MLWFGPVMTRFCIRDFVAYRGGGHVLVRGVAHEARQIIQRAREEKEISDL